MRLKAAAVAMAAVEDHKEKDVVEVEKEEDREVRPFMVNSAKRMD